MPDRLRRLGIPAPCAFARTAASGGRCLPQIGVAGYQRTPEDILRMDARAFAAGSRVVPPGVAQGLEASHCVIEGAAKMRELFTSDVQGAVVEAMAEHVKVVLTPISEVESDDSGLAWGSGTYLKLRGKAYLLTNEHVAAKMADAPIAHLPRPDDSYVRVTNPMQALEYPVDAALSRIDDVLWHGATQRALPSRRLAERFSPVDYEYLFIAGFPGKSSPVNRRRSYFGVLHVPGRPYLTQQAPLPDGYDPSAHFAIHYPQEANRAGGGRAELSDPSGMSGSLIWDTRFIATRGRHWSPEGAVVCGIVHRWEPDVECLVGTRVEVVSEFLLKALRLEAAYFRSLDRMCSSEDALANWLWAERTVENLGS
jgi:hypothetical protein